jgi:hypothetical protein
VSRVASERNESARSAMGPVWRIRTKWRYVGKVFVGAVTMLLLGCDNSYVPNIRRDFCEKEGRKLSDEEKIVNALAHAFHHYEVEADHKGATIYSAPDFRTFIRQNAADSSEVSIRDAAKKFYLQNRRCCRVLLPWALRDESWEAGSESFAKYEWNEKNKKFSWVRDVNIRAHSSSVPENMIEVEIGSCGETTLRYRG